MPLLSGHPKPHTMKPSKYLRAVCTGLALASSTAMGAFTFTDGDLILGFQATSGEGQTKNLFFNLGAGTYHRDNPGDLGNPTAIGNIGQALSNAYGSGWYGRSDVYFGIIGNLRSLGLPFAPNAPVAGDPNSTFYLSAPAATVGSGSLYAAGTYAAATLQSTSTKLGGLEGIFGSLTQEVGNTVVLDQVANPVQWQNGWTKWNPIANSAQGIAFDAFGGGIQQNFGKGSSATYIDLQRVLADNTGATPSGVVGGGAYETTFAIYSDGSIASVPEPSSGLLALGAGLALAFRRRRNA